MAHSVLVVDDEAGVREMLCDYLGAHGFETRQAENGLQALQAIESRSPEVVVLDMRMPVMDGWTFLETLRRDSKLPVLVLTAESDESDRARTFELGANDYLSKPFKLSEVEARIEALIGA
ncbi:MAG TPA: response regulator [Chloroflexota bacterium]|nr:response regulator [Chloroflexota bacterium]